MADKHSDRELQETLIKIESGKKQLEALLQQGRMAETALVEFATTIEVLEQVKKNKPGTEILVPIGGDSFIKATLKDNQNVIVGVGAKVSVEKSPDEAIKTLKERSEELSKTLAKIRESAMKIGGQIEEMNELAQHIFQHQNEKK
jgi:prefoldin alpha subunit